ncbi:MAG TPA: DUF4166 domain-containing protein [Allosphingosinicella sp.]|jgi:hypothetical protein
MKSALIIGGYGGFGARVSLLLARAGWTVIVAGRSGAKAAHFCRSHHGLPLRPAVLDRNRPLAPILRDLQPWLVIDAAGPFQDCDYRVAEGCIEAGCHYLDLADARAFVIGISRLDARAKAAGLCLISGASSVPALTAAVADRLATGLDRVTLIDIALSASNRASGSRSVTAAILSYLGKPIRLWRGGRWDVGHGWQELSRLRFEVPGERPILRHVALCDVPDLDLLPARYPGRPAVRFRAGSELAVQNIGLWLLSWAVRWGWVRGLAGLTGLAVRVQIALRRLGGDRSAMSVQVMGWTGERAIQRCWTIYASRGDGPWIPALASPLIADELARGSLEPGAYPAVGLIDLDLFERAFAPFAIRTASQSEDVQPLYRRIMGADYDALAPAVRAMHALTGDAGASGEAEVTSGGQAGRFIGRLFGLPPPGRDVPLHLWMREEGGVETWTRTFGNASFSSRLSRRGSLLTESFGPFRFAMALQREPDGLSMHFQRWWIGPMPMPGWLGPRIRGTEAERNGVFHFDVEIGLPLIGLVTGYRGWLTRTAGA